MSAAWPVWNNDNPLPGPPPRAWVPVVIENRNHPVPSVAAPGSAMLPPPAATRSRRWALGPALSLLIHGAALAAGILLFLPADDPFDIEGSAVEVEIISMQTVASNEASDVQSEATQSMVSAGAEAVEATEPETLEPVAPEATTTPEAVEPIEAEPLEPTEPVTAATAEPVEPIEAIAAETIPLLASTAVPSEPLDSVQPETAAPVEPVETPAAVAPQETAEAIEPTEVVEASEPVDPDAPPVPQTRTVKQKQEPTVPKEEPRKDPPKQQPQKPRPSAGGNGGNSNADAKAGAPAAAQQGTGPQGDGAAFTKYSGQVRSKLRRALRYPSGARGAGEVQVQFTVSASGAASGIRVVASSGNPVFDNAAIETVRRASPFPAIPADAGKDSWTFTMPLGFVR